MASMAIDHYVAICNPFSYITIMNYRGCVLLWSSPSAFHISPLLPPHSPDQLIHLITSNAIHHFFCDDQSMLKLSHYSHFVKKKKNTVMTEELVVIMTPFSCIIISYLRILTCSADPFSCWDAQSMFHLQPSSHGGDPVSGNISYVYFQPLSNYTVVDRRAKVVYNVYNILTSMLNPFI